MRNRLHLLLGIGSLVAALSAGCVGKRIPAHPDRIAYPPLQYQVPPASECREVLSNGMVVYIAEDRLLPTFDLTVAIRTGAAFEPPDKAGLASLVGEQLRDGGTQDLSPEELDERVEFLAASLFSSIGETRGTAGVSSLSKDIDEGLALLVEMLRYPRFDQERLRLARERRLQNIKRRNDSTGSIESIEWGFLMNGEDHYSNRYPSSETIQAITREDLLEFHSRYYHPANMIVAVAGDFDRAEMLDKLEQAFADWPVGEPATQTFPKPDHEPMPGVYLIQKEDVNQGRVSIGHKAVCRGSPDEFALRVMNGILGGTGFKSRLTAKVRSDEGLAYSVGSRFGQGVYYPGDFRCYFQSKSNACAYAAQLVLDEIARLQKESISRQEVEETISYYVESFPQRFQSKMTLLRTYVGDEYTGRDPQYWQTYVDNLERVRPDDVMRVARQYLHPESLVILAVGEADAIEAGGHDKAPDLGFDVFGPLTRLPLRDPDTLKR